MRTKEEQQRLQQNIKDLTALIEEKQKKNIRIAKRGFIFRQSSFRYVILVSNRFGRKKIVK